jgi:23S rRNA (guanine2535-N1)-methyltransferase
MPYKFALQPSDYSDLSAGRVLYSQPGLTAFPVRLASETFQRCQAIRARMGYSGRVSIYDPCCGGAYLLTILGFLHGNEISAVSASDINPEALDLAARNLSLLSLVGLDRRMDEINHYIQAYGKASHQAALDSAVRLRDVLGQALAGRRLPTRLFQADATSPQAMRQGLAGQPMDLVITDIPYGWKSAWSLDEKPGESRLLSSGSSLNSSQEMTPVTRLLDALHTLLPARCLLAVASDKLQKVAHSDYRRLDKFQVGKRQVTILLRAGR